MNHQFSVKNGNKFLLRKLESKDAKKILEYINIVGGETDFLLFDSKGLGLSLAQEEEILDRNFRHPNSLLIGCFIDEEVVAVANLTVKKRVRINHIASIGISVKKKYWNQGIGTEILSYFVNYSLNNRQIEIIDLRVRTDNFRAIKIYQNMGFEMVGTIPKAIKIDDEYYEHYMMIKDVS